MADNVVSNTLDNVIITPLEEVFDAVGAMQGEMAPLKRALIGGAVGAAIVYGFKPSICFDKVTHLPRPWALTAQGAEKDKATWLPYWMVIGIPAVVFSTFI